MRFSLDTNVLVYAVDKNAGDRHQVALDIVRRARGRDCIITLQALSELFRTLTAKGKVAPAAAVEIVQGWRDAAPIFAADEACLLDAMEVVLNHTWSFWDAMMWATVKRAGCRVLISEDGQDGRVLGGITIVNPFVPSPSPLLREVLGTSGAGW